MIAATLAMAGAVALAQTPARRHSAHRAPAGMTSARGHQGRRHHGHATFVERQQGTGTVVEFTLTCRA